MTIFMTLHPLVSVALTSCSESSFLGMRVMLQWDTDSGECCSLIVETRAHNIRACVRGSASRSQSLLCYVLFRHFAIPSVDHCPAIVCIHTKSNVVANMHHRRKTRVSLSPLHRGLCVCAIRIDTRGKRQRPLPTYHNIK